MNVDAATRLGNRAIGPRLCVRAGSKRRRIATARDRQGIRPF